MCGIAGVVYTDAAHPVDAALVRRMSRICVDDARDSTHGQALSGRDAPARCCGDSGAEWSDRRLTTASRNAASVTPSTSARSVRPSIVSLTPVRRTLHGSIELTLAPV